MSVANKPHPLDPEIAAGLPPGAFDFDEWTLDTIGARRAARAALPVPAPPATTTVFRDEDVDEAVRVRVYAPPDAGPPRPCVFWIHGGGYITGSALAVDSRLNRWVEALDCVVVAVDYRLAPEHPYPVPLEDCYAGLNWVIKHAERLGVDPARVVIAGASAGAGLAAAVALLARDRGGPPLAHQVLIYPMLDDREITPSSQLDGAAVWGGPANRLGWRAYLGPHAGGQDVPAYAAPARAADLAGLPPAFIAVGGADLFRDESVEYASRLLEAGVPAELHVYPGAPHGFEVIVPAAGVSRRCDAEIAGALRRALHPVLPAPRPDTPDNPATGGAPGLDLADRTAIEAVVLSYATAMDTGDWERFRSCFRPDARTVMDRIGEFGTCEAVIELLESRLKTFAALQHFVSNVVISGDGDAATAATYFVSHHVPYGTAPYTYGGTFDFTLVRDREGWRATSHTIRILWEAGRPARVGAS
jgi:acetyl esterase/lipase/3-phenylpropionate/cinnamic acid dioxygenase small subunit